MLPFGMLVGAGASQVAGHYTTGALPVQSFHSKGCYFGGGAGFCLSRIIIILIIIIIIIVSIYEYIVFF